MSNTWQDHDKVDLTSIAEVGELTKAVNEIFPEYSKDALGKCLPYAMKGETKRGRLFVALTLVKYMQAASAKKT